MNDDNLPPPVGIFLAVTALVASLTGHVGVAYGIARLLDLGLAAQGSGVRAQPVAVFAAYGTVATARAVFGKKPSETPVWGLAKLAIRDAAVENLLVWALYATALYAF